SPVPKRPVVPLPQSGYPRSLRRPRWPCALPAGPTAAREPTRPAQHPSLSARTPPATTGKTTLSNSCSMHPSQHRHTGNVKTGPANGGHVTTSTAAATTQLLLITGATTVIALLFEHAFY